MAIELLLFCVVIALAGLCLLLIFFSARNHAQIRELEAVVERLEKKLAPPAPSPLHEEPLPAPQGRVLRLIRPAELEAEVRALAQEGRMLEAVQRYRRETGVSLQDAHAAVRQILEG